MADITKKYPSIADVSRDFTLFLKVKSDIPLALSDFTTIAEGRWDFFRNNWDFIKVTYLDRISKLNDGPQKVNAYTQYMEFGKLIDGNRTSSQNPLSNRNNLRKFKDLLDLILISDLDTSIAEQNIIQDEIDRINRLEKDDFYQMRERVRITHDKTADSVGLSDDTYNQLYERVSGPKIMTFKFNDYPVLSALMEFMKQISNFIPTKLVQDERQDPFSVIRNALNNPGIPINSYQSGFIIPFQYGMTMERLAATYLGSPDKALEIATANGLKFPYVDEVGKKTFLSINGIANTVIVPLEESINFFIGQDIQVKSDGQPVTNRKIIDIEENKNNEQLVITVNGESNLSKYTTLQRAYIYSYAPYTINSSKMIMIPTTGTLGFPINAQEPWFVKNLPNDLKNMGVDLALNADDDLVISNSGDLSLIYGLANATQALNLKMKTKAGELVRDPSFGLVEIAGTYKNSEISQVMMTWLVESTIAGDDRFDGIDGLGFNVVDSVVYINASIRLKGSSGSIPLTFQLPR